MKTIVYFHKKFHNFIIIVDLGLYDLYKIKVEYRRWCV